MLRLVSDLSFSNVVKLVRLLTLCVTQIDPNSNHWREAGEAAKE
jgi:hypothetical protein